MRSSVSFATDAAAAKRKYANHNNSKKAAAPVLDPSSYSGTDFNALARFNLPTIASSTTNTNSPRSRNLISTANSNASNKPSENNTSSHIKIPDEIEQFQKLTPRQRIKLEFKLQNKVSAKQRPSHLFGSSFDREAAKRTDLQSREGFRNDQLKRKTERDELRQSLRLSRSNLAMSMSLAIEKGVEEKAPDPKLARPSPWVKNEYGADRHKFQVNWPDRSGAPLPTIPQKWSAPGPGAYQLDTTFGKFDGKLVRETIRETLAEDAKRRSRKH